jgi:hypothetical protein
MWVTLDLPMTAWLARELNVSAVAACTWGDGYGCIAFDATGLGWNVGHIRDERSDMHLHQALKAMDIPFCGDEDGLSSDRTYWRSLDISPRSW